MKILLTGATGYLGRRLLKSLLKVGFEVGITVRHTVNTSFPVQQILMSAEDHPADLKRTLESYDCILHAATCYGRKGEPQEYIRAVNFDWPQRLLESTSPQCRFLHIDTSLPATLSTYAGEKARLREFLNSSAQSGRRVLNVRLEHYLGPGDGHFLSHVLTSFFKGDPAIQLTDGLQRRDFIWVDDAVSAITFIIGHLTSGTSLPNAVSIGSGEARSIRSVVEALKALTTPCSTELQFGAVPKRQGEPELLCSDLSTMRKLGWTPSTRWADALKAFVYGSMELWEAKKNLNNRPELLS